MNDPISIPGCPRIPGLSFRGFRGGAGFAGMTAVKNAAAEADGLEGVATSEDFAASYAHLYNCDLGRDFLAAEVDGRMVGYERGYWEIEESSGAYIYGIVGQLAPEWRRRGLGGAMLRWLEDRMAEVARGHPAGAEKLLESFCLDGEEGRRVLLEREGYEPVRYINEMIRPSLDELPDFSLPAGLEVRPVEPGQYRAIWDAWQESMRDHWGYSRPDEELYLRWLGNERYFQPEIWQVAWDRETGAVAGNVLGYIDREENEKFARLRGYTERIAVGRPWRRRGLARALIALSLAAQLGRGMTESALSVDSENRTGATRVYEDCGFRVVKTHRIYRKAL